jgi:hypothetical protein
MPPKRKVKSAAASPTVTAAIAPLTTPTPPDTAAIAEVEAKVASSSDVSSIIRTCHATGCTTPAGDASLKLCARVRSVPDMLPFH